MCGGTGSYLWDGVVVRTACVHTCEVLIRPQCWEKTAGVLEGLIREGWTGFKGGLKPRRGTEICFQASRVFWTNLSKPKQISICARNMLTNKAALRTQKTEWRKALIFVGQHCTGQTEGGLTGWGRKGRQGQALSSGRRTGPSSEP